ncbi:MAG: hypothetical protein HY866_04130 [Chloroflexi bacterium]|nr:hypothetical protein [Chloroflexota bacterium]
MSKEYLDGWLKSDATREDSIMLKRLYIDIFGNLVDGVLFAQIMYWHTPVKGGGPRLRIEREGHLWLAKNYDDWMEECRIPAGTARDSLRRMENLGIVIKRVWHFGQRKVPHYRIDPERFQMLVNAVENGTIEEVRQMLFDAAKQRKKEAKTRQKVSDGSQQIPQTTSKRRQPTDISVGSQQMQMLAANTCIRGLPTDVIYTETTNTETTTETTPSSLSPSTTESIDSASPPPVVAVVAADVEMIKSEVQKLRLTPQRQADLLAKGAAYALAITWAVHGPRITNPGGLAMTLLKGDGPPEQLLYAAEVALELGITDRQKAEEQLNRRALAELEESLRESADESTEPPESPAESKNDIVSHLIPGGETSKQGVDQAGNGLDYKPGGGPFSMRDIWQLVDGSLSLQLNKSTYEQWIRGTRAVSFADGVLTLRARNGMARDELERRFDYSIKLQIGKLTSEEVKLCYIADTPGAIPRGIGVPGNTGLVHKKIEGQEQCGLLGPQRP